MLQIQGPQKTTGTVSISGSKNAALPLIACGLFFETFTLHNVPRIGDVFTFLSIIESLGVDVKLKENTLTLDTKNMSLENLNRELVSKIRVGIFLFPALLQRFGELKIPYPGGCNIGKRPITEHLKAFESFGYMGSGTGEEITFSGKADKSEVNILANFAVTATENALMMAAFQDCKTTISLAAIEPHVINLVDFLKSIGVQIEITYDHTIIVHGISKIPKQATGQVIHDYIESGTFIILGALTAKESITIKNARIQDLTFFLEKCRQVGVKMDIDTKNDSVKVYNSTGNIQATKLQTNIFPGFPTDLQSPFSLLLTQAEGVSQVHEILFESRLNWLIEVEKMKGHIAILNPHEALIFGKTPLRGATVSSWDLRAGVTMILAGMLATGKTKITNVEYIERGYEDIVGKIQRLGGKIEQI
ncbi:hypothetical protein CSB09_03270 [Candidatus Gracilibacteria bacterium]|nr:MAG: hypothetical protein CSB09_03270 [Candidatus Gracilibacteria bacterium]